MTSVLPRHPMLTLLDTENRQQLLRPDSQLDERPLQANEKCSACGEEICERYFLQTGDSSYWHAHCLRCAVCQMPLAQEVTCYCKHGLVYCKQDYARIFKCGTCARCGQKIETNELVMRVPGFVFHLDCFACATCGRRLHTGELFGLQEGIVYCRDDYEVLLQTLRHRRLSEATSLSFCAQAPAFYNGTGAVQKGRPRKKRIDEVALEDFDRRSEEYSLSSPPRQKRMRTSFKHHQIRTMKAYFGLNHNPDAKDLKQLAEKTGLSKRVLQVWFQNARAKFRRSLLRQEGNQTSAASAISAADCEASTVAAADLDLLARAADAAAGADGISDASSDYLELHLVNGAAEYSDSVLDDNSNSALQADACVSSEMSS